MRAFELIAWRGIVQALALVGLWVVCGVALWAWLNWLAHSAVEASQ